MAKAKGKRTRRSKAKRAKSKAKGKRTRRSQSPAQKRAQADFAAFYAAHGRGPRKGESVKGYAARGGAQSLPSRAWRAVRKNPGKTVLALLGVGVGAAASTAEGRKALAETGSKAVAFARNPWRT